MRPGVPTTMSGPRRMRSSCGRRPTPPRMTQVETGCPAAKLRIAASICRASSRVGARISARVENGRARRRLATRCWIIGSAKAAVLPVPVCAMPSRSWPASRCGMAPAWIGEGVVKFCAARARSEGSASPSSPKFGVRHRYRGISGRGAGLSGRAARAFIVRQPRVTMRANRFQVDFPDGRLPGGSAPLRIAEVAALISGPAARMARVVFTKRRGRLRLEAA